MIEDLNVPIRIEVCPTIREPDGVALSSRNAYLDAAQRDQARALHRSLRAAVSSIAAGERSAGIIRHQMRQVLLDAGIDRIDYVALVEGETLDEMEEISGPVVALVAAFVGETRLIDNIPIPG
jgi:pantoate--beta-alanine ligase